MSSSKVGHLFIFAIIFLYPHSVLGLEQGVQIFDHKIISTLKKNDKLGLFLMKSRLVLESFYTVEKRRESVVLRQYSPIFKFNDRVYRKYSKPLPKRTLLREVSKLYIISSQQPIRDYLLKLSNLTAVTSVRTLSSSEFSVNLSEYVVYDKDVVKKLLVKLQ